MNKLEAITYYSFGWIVLFFLNWRRWQEVPRWFWAIDWCLKTPFRLVWLGIVTVWWLPREEWKWERMNGRRPYGWEWNID